MSPGPQSDPSALSPLAILRRGYIDLVTCGAEKSFPEVCRLFFLAAVQTNLAWKDF